MVQAVFIHNGTYRSVGPKDSWLRNFAIFKQFQQYLYIKHKGLLVLISIHAYIHVCGT